MRLDFDIVQREGRDFHLVHVESGLRWETQACDMPWRFLSAIAEGRNRLELEVEFCVVPHTGDYMVSRVTGHGLRLSPLRGVVQRFYDYLLLCREEVV